MDKYCILGRQYHSLFQCPLNTVALEMVINSIRSVEMCAIVARSQTAYHAGVPYWTFFCLPMAVADRHR